MQQQAILKHFRDNAASEPLYLPNLTLWYDWHAERDTLPNGWRGWSLPQIAHSLGVPAWLTVRPFRVDPGSVEIVKTEVGRRAHGPLQCTQWHTVRAMDPRTRRRLVGNRVPG